MQPTIYPRPTLEEVAAYLEEAGIDTFTAEEFWTYYERTGWRINGEPIRSWKAIADAWHRKRLEESRYLAPAPAPVPVRVTVSEPMGWKVAEGSRCPYCGGAVITIEESWKRSGVASPKEELRGSLVCKTCGTRWDPCGVFDAFPPFQFARFAAFDPLTGLPLSMPDAEREAVMAELHMNPARATIRRGRPCPEPGCRGHLQAASAVRDLLGIRPGAVAVHVSELWCDECGGRWIEGNGESLGRVHLPELAAPEPDGENESEVTR